MNDFNISTGRRIYALREKAELTREELGERACLSDRFIYDIETGRKGMSAETLSKIADALCVSTDYILRGAKTQTQNAELIDMLSSFSDSDLPHAQNLLRTFATALSEKNR